jgi:hypothetical protein
MIRRLIKAGYTNQTKEKNMDLSELIEAIWEKAQEEHSRNVLDWQALESVVIQGLETWGEEDLIEEAQNLGIDVQQVKP